MNAAILAIALTQSATVGYGGDYGGGSGCSLSCVHRRVEYFFGSWYLQPQYSGSCNDRYYHQPTAHHGQYYDRPYSYRQVIAQSRDGVRMGEESQSPYASAIFRRRYREKPEATPDHINDPEPIPADPRPLRRVPRAVAPNGSPNPISY
jgi:hypothetical protein